MMNIVESDTKLEEITGLKFKYINCEVGEAPLVFLVHGRAGNFDVMATFRRCLPVNCNIFFPQAFMDDPIGGYSWWKIDELGKAQSFDRILEASSRLSRFIDNSIAAFSLKPSSISVIGFSQGAGLTSLLAQLEPHRFNSIALLAGFVFEHRTEPKPNLAGLEVFIAHGENDGVIPIAKAEQGARYLRGLGAKVDFITDPVGHKVGVEGMRALKAWCHENI